MIYLDNASTSWPKPEIVYQTMDEFHRKTGASPGRGGHRLARATEAAIDEARVLLARFFNAAEKDRIIFTFNCTDALNLGLKGLLRPGDHVVTSCIGHNSLVRPLNKLEQQGVKVTRLAPCSDDGFVSPSSIEEAIIKDTRLVAVTHASNVTGVIQPIEEYGAITAKHDVLFMVDAAQTVGIYPIDIQASNIDLLACSGHKGLLGPQGTGVLCLSERVELDTLREGGTGSQSELEEQPEDLPYKYESGTPNAVGIVGLSAGVRYILSEGLDRIRAHAHSLLERLVDGLSQIPDVVLYGPRDRSTQTSILSLNLKGWNPGEAATILDQAFDIGVRAGLHCAAAAHKTFGTYPSGTIRFSPGYFNTEEEIDFAVQALAKICSSKPVWVS